MEIYPENSQSIESLSICLEPHYQLVYGEEFQAEVEGTVKRNIYEDNMMKCASTTEKAIVSVGHLRRPSLKKRIPSKKMV